MTGEQLAKIRANVALALEEFRDLNGPEFGLDANSVTWVEGFIERMRQRMGSQDAPGGVVAVLGSYLGEAIIARAGGSWVEDDDGSVGVRFANGDTVYPFAKVRKQFEQGLEAGESIASFYNVSVNFVAAGKLHEGRAGEAS